MKLNRRSEAGLATLETALVLPLLLLVIFAILELGLAFARLQVIQNAAREAARAAVLFDPACTPARMQSRANAAVAAFGNTLGMGTLANPTLSFPLGIPAGQTACSAPVVRASLTFQHEIPLTAAFGSFFRSGGAAFIPLPGSSTAATQPTRTAGS